MSIGDFGFKRDTFEEILDRLATQILNAMPEVTLTPDNPIYQLMKIYASEIMRLEILLDEAYKNMTVVGASGTWLRAHGIEAGVVIKPPSYAHGTVYMDGPMESGGLYIPLNTEFNSDDGKRYVSYEDVVIYESFNINVDGAGTYDMNYECIPSKVMYVDTIELNKAQYSVDGSTITLYDIAAPTNTLYSLDTEIPTVTPADGDEIVVTQTYTAANKYDLVVYNTGVYNVSSPVNDTLYSDATNYNYYTSGNLYDITSGLAVNGVIKDDTTYTTASNNAGNYFTYRYNNNGLTSGKIYISDGAGTFTEDTTVSFADGSVIDDTATTNYKYLMAGFIWTEIDTTVYTTVSAFTDSYYYNNATQYMLTRDWSFTKDYIYKYDSALGYYSTFNIPSVKQTYEYDSNYYVYYNDEWSQYEVVDYTSSNITIYIGTVKFDVKIRSNLIGSIGNISSNRINECPSFPDFEVNNDSPILNGTDIESDESYRNRILHTKRANFNTWSIMEKLYESTIIKKVRAVPTLGTDINLDLDDTSYYSKSIAFEYTAGDGIVTLKGIRLTVGGMGKPDNIRITLYRLNNDLTSYTDIDNGTELYNTEFSYNDLVEYPAATTIEYPIQEISVNLKYDSILPNVIYGIKVELPAGNDTNTTDYWRIYKAANDTGTHIICYEEDAITSSIRPSFATKYGTNAYHIYYVKNEGYTDEDVMDIIDGKLDPNTGYGFEPMGTVRIEEEATKVLVNVYTEVYIDSRYNQTNVRDTIINNLYEYVDNLYMGDNVNYSKIEQIILSTGGVIRAMNTKVSIDGKPYIDSNTSNDLVIHDYEYGVLNTNAEGDWTLTSDNLKGVEVVFI